VAYPDYSIVIISVTEGGVTTDYAKCFFNNALADKYYKQAVSEGKRAFYFDRPTPSRFERNDTQKLVVNSQKNLELQPVTTPSASGDQGSTITVKEAFSVATSIIVESNLKVIETIQTASFQAGEKVYEIHDNLFTKIRKFIGFEYKPYNTIAAELTHTNKRIVLRHNGSGFFLAPTITKLWPDKDEYVDQQPVPFLIDIEGAMVGDGLKTERRTYNGMQSDTGVVSYFYQYLPEDTLLFETIDFKFLSDGAGWYTRLANGGGGGGGGNSYSNCDQEGTLYQEEIGNALNSGLTNDEGVYIPFVNGNATTLIKADGKCGTSQEPSVKWMEAGVAITEDFYYVYKHDGNGGYSRELQPNVADPEIPTPEDGHDPEKQCPPAGDIAGEEREYTQQEVIGNDERLGEYRYNPVVHIKVIMNDGECGTYVESERDEFVEAGIFIKTNYQESTGKTWIMVTDVNGGWGAYEAFDTTETDGSNVPDPEPPPEEPTVVEPPPPPPEDPCTGGNPNSPTGTYRRKPNGDFWGKFALGGLKRKVTIGVPAGYQSSNIAGTGTGTTWTFCTGQRWMDRQISKGSCEGWSNEPNASESTWQQPAGADCPSFPAGPALMGGQGGVANSNEEVIKVFYKLEAKVNGVQTFSTKQFFPRHDGHGNVAWVPYSNN